MNSASFSRRTRIKVCGITRPEDALAAAALGVDALGFVFYRKSPRHIDPQRAAAIIRAVPPFVSAVGLFVNPTRQEIEETLAACPLDVIQLHGDETPGFCLAQTRRVIKAVAISSAADLQQVGRYHCPVLLDAKAPPEIYGGTGKAFDWSLLHGFRHDDPLILAGGLNSENVRHAASIRQWFALDVSSGVESSPGIKDADKMRTFVAAVRSCDSEHVTIHAR